MKSSHKSEGKGLTRKLATGVLALGSLGILTAYYMAGCQSQPPVKQLTQAEMVERGSYLVTAGHCNDCHTPWIMGAKGPEPDTSRMLSGHPQDLKMPTIKLPQEPWQAVASATFTAWCGPWGTSFTANLTPDTMTGLGSWTAEMFIQAMRIGKHMGQPGSWDIKPPMPWYNLAKMTDEDLRAIFAYLQSIPAIRNKVPDPVAPAIAHK